MTTLRLHALTITSVGCSAARRAPCRFLAVFCGGGTIACANVVSRIPVPHYYDLVAQHCCRKAPGPAPRMGSLTRLSAIGAYPPGLRTLHRASVPSRQALLSLSPSLRTGRAGLRDHDA